MAEAQTGDHEQCHALTRDGERCTRPAQEDGFCYQHDESDETIDEADDGPSGPADAEGGQDASDTDMSQTETEPADDEQSQQDASASESADEQAQQAQEDEDVEAESVDGVDLWEARDTAERVAKELIDDPFDGIVEISPDDDGWRVVLEVIERRAIPDTQDILGRYDVTVGSSGDLEGYRLTGRYRRGDVSDEQTPEH